MGSKTHFDFVFCYISKCFHVIQSVGINPVQMWFSLSFVKKKLNCLIVQGKDRANS